MPGDIKDPAHCRAIVAKAVSAFGRIDVLVNNAAHQATFASIEDIGDEEWDVTFRTNIHAMFYLTKAAVPHMQAGGSIINTASINADTPSPNLLAYATTKGAIQNFTGWAGAASGRERHPGELRRAGADLDAADSLDNAGGQGQEFRQAGADAASRTAQRSLRRSTCMLAADEASYMSGATVAVTGGKPDPVSRTTQWDPIGLTVPVVRRNRRSVLVVLQPLTKAIAHEGTDLARQGRHALRERARPKIEHPRDAIIKVTACAICGSDLHIYDGVIPQMKSGDVLGHETMGEVVEVGAENTQAAKVGDRVVVPFTIACGECFFCQRGYFSGCERTNPERRQGRQTVGPFAGRPVRLLASAGRLSRRPGGVSARALRRCRPDQGAGRD